MRIEGLPFSFLINSIVLQIKVKIKVKIAQTSSPKAYRRLAPKKSSIAIHALSA